MDGRGWNTGNQPPVRNNDTESPFEEPEQSPELRACRSRNLYSREEPFWEKMQDAPPVQNGTTRDVNYWNHPEVVDRQKIMTRDRWGLHRVKKYLGARVIRKILIIAAIVAVVLVILYSAVFNIRSISVVGNVNISPEAIIRLSGLQMGQNAVRIDEEEVMRRIETNRYLRCTLVDVQWDSVTIHVRERTPAAYMNHNGMMVTLDNRGYVLEETLNSNAVQPGMIKVVGLDVRRCTLGQKLTLGISTQLETYTQILVELKAMKGLELIGELDMTSMDSIYLATRPVNEKKFYIRLGNEEGIHEKLRAFMITRERILEMGKTSGTIDVTDPGRPTYMPERN